MSFLRKMFKLYTTKELVEIDRCARAYGYEVGKGNPLANNIVVSEDNPFLNPNWRSNMENL